MEVTPSDAIAASALIVSVVAIWRQRKYDEQAKRLNDLLIDKEVAETVAAHKADLSANFVKVGKSSYQFRIFNRGKGAARNIRMEIIEGAKLFATNEIAGKFPYPALQYQQPLNIPIFIHMQSPRRANVLLRWDDEAGGGTSEIVADVF